MSGADLPADVDAFMDDVGRNVQASGCLAWEERDKIRSDMCKVRYRWYASRVAPDALRIKCQAIGLRDDETAAYVLGLLAKIHSGKEIRRPQRPTYRDYRWPQDPTDDA